MKRKLKVKMPLIVISGIFILLIVFINYPINTIGKSNYERLKACLRSLTNNNYSVYGTIRVSDKNEDVLLLENMSLLYKGVIRNSDNKLKLDLTLSVDDLQENKIIGNIYRIDDKLYFQFPTIEKNYYLDIGNNHNMDNINFEKVKEIVNYIDSEKIIKSRSSILTNDKFIEIMTNKISTILNKDDMVTIMDIITINGDYDFNRKLDKLNINDFHITFNSYIDNRDYIKKEEIIFENNDLELMLTCYLDNYNKVNDIQIEDLSDNYSNIKDIKENDVLELIWNMLFEE
ncbi:hypothetical protein SH1V18_31030 [Vallitalea longa]|uniref:Uncharacterized protein n=1 Tax=Vallitalea longa TaxID=2936439 RepID=A0A9W5YE14_9FIRM|nr:hypothetical protein [Vallitalea longa]GKX30623.1 hypothetical protein SH1V18_31030 [Vallitalea longa]